MSCFQLERIDKETKGKDGKRTRNSEIPVSGSYSLPAQCRLGSLGAQESFVMGAHQTLDSQVTHIHWFSQ